MIKKLEAGNSKLDQTHPVWNLETGQEFATLTAAAHSVGCWPATLHKALACGHRCGGFYWTRTKPAKHLQIFASAVDRLQQFARAGELPQDIRAALLASLMLLFLLVCPLRASVTYDVSIDTRSLPAGSYQAAFFLSDLQDNFSQAKLPVGFSIDGDIITDDTHYYADQPVIDFGGGSQAKWPLDFNLTLNGTAGSSDYFSMAIRTPDGGIFDAPDGNQWLLWAAMDQDSPVLQLDLPGITAAAAPEPSIVLILSIIGLVLLMRGI